MKYVGPSPHYAYLGSLLSFCGREKNYRLGSSLHAAIVKNINHFVLGNRDNFRNVMVVWNALISMYSKCGHLCDARKVFDGMRLKDSISWNSIIAGCLIKGDCDRGIGVFREMLRSDVSFCDHATLTTVLSIYAEMELLSPIGMVHGLVILNGFELEVPVTNALVTAYFKCAHPDLAQKVFDGMIERNIITWTAMVSGLAQISLCKESFILFKEMRSVVEANALTYSSSLLACSGLRALHEGQQVHALLVKSGFEQDLCVESALMDLYSKCSVMDDALRIFLSCEKPDEVSLTVILVGLAQNGLEEEAFKLFAEMFESGIEIDANMVSAILGAFGATAPLGLGKQIHSLVTKKSLGKNLFVSNGLVNMYAKCGEVMDSIKVFRLMELRNSVSWNSMIVAFAHHGRWSETLQLYENMKAEGIAPSDVTFLLLLNACSHAGYIQKGMDLLSSMYLDYGVAPRIDHYACIIDMLGRAGDLDEARKFIEELPVEPKAHLWQALLGACCVHGNLEMGRYAAERLILLMPECTAAYVLLANIYSSEGRWSDRARIIKTMKDMGVKKDLGASWIEINKEVHVFVVEDRAHPQGKVIYEVLDELFALIRDHERVLHQRFLLSDQEANK